MIPSSTGWRERGQVLFHLIFGEHAERRIFLADHCHLNLAWLEINSKHVSEASQRHLNGLVQIPLLVSLPLLYLLLQKSVGFSLLHSGRNRVESAVVACRVSFV